MNSPRQPLTSDALTVRLTRTGGPVLVTEYMPGAPTQVLNTGGAPVYLGKGSSVGAGNGVPLAANASLNWTAAGELWAILDPAATSDSGSVLISGLVSDYSNPVAVALQIAAQGVPNVFLADVLGENALAANASSIAYDVTRYASVQIKLFGVGNVWVLQYDSTGTCIQMERISLVEAINTAFAFPVTGVKLQIVNNTAAVLGAHVVGTNRVEPRVRTVAQHGPRKLFANLGLATGQTVQLLGYSNGISEANSVASDGPVDFILSLPGTITNNIALIVAYYSNNNERASFTTMFTGAITRVPAPSDPDANPTQLSVKGLYLPLGQSYVYLFNGSGSTITGFFSLYVIPNHGGLN